MSDFQSFFDHQAADSGAGDDAHLFHDNPEKREVREFAESGALSNEPPVAEKAVEEVDNPTETPAQAEEQAEEAPPTPDEIQAEPGGAEFSTLNRFVVDTAEERPPRGGWEGNVKSKNLMEASLSRAIMRVAYEHPEFQSDLLDLLKGEGYKPRPLGRKATLVRDVDDAYLDGHFTDEQSSELREVAETAVSAQMARGEVAGPSAPAILQQDLSDPAVRNQVIRFIYDNPEYREMVLPRLTAPMDVIPGGEAAGKSPSEYPADQLAKGIDVEMEHSDDPVKALEISMDHMEEAKGAPYYDALAEMEEGLGIEANLRSKVIRLAHDKPELRRDLIPLLREEG